MKTVGLVQAHYRGWGGARDLSLATLNGKPAVAEVIGRLKSMPQVAEVVVAVPDDPGNAVFRTRPTNNFLVGVRSIRTIGGPSLMFDVDTGCHKQRRGFIWKSNHR